MRKFFVSFYGGQSYIEMGLGLTLKVRTYIAGNVLRLTSYCSIGKYVKELPFIYFFSVFVSFYEGNTGIEMGLGVEVYIDFAAKLFSLIYFYWRV